MWIFTFNAYIELQNINGISGRWKKENKIIEIFQVHIYYMLNKIEYGFESHMWIKD